MFKSIVKCQLCNKVSNTYDPFMALSVPSTEGTIQDALDSLLQEELLQSYFCTNCKQETKEATLKV